MPDVIGSRVSEVQEPTAECSLARRTVRRWLRIALGSTLLALGIVGLFLPFLQGVLFIVLGLSLLSPESERARRLQQWLRSRWLHRKRKVAEWQRSN